MRRLIPRKLPGRRCGARDRSDRASPAQIVEFVRLVTGGLSNEIKKHADGIGFLEADRIDEVGWPQSGGLQGPKLLVDVWSRISPFDDKSGTFLVLVKGR